MALVEYGSDSENEGVSPPAKSPTAAPPAASIPAVADKEKLITALPELSEASPPPQGSNNSPPPREESYPQPPENDRPNGSPTKTSILRSTLPPGPLVGPSLPPASPPQDTSSPPLSPYSATRSEIRSLTLPPSIPSLPPSPTGPEPTELTKKFSHFLELKRSSVHFNEKLLRSSTLHNPRLLEKLLSFVGVENSYVSNLPKDLWDPQGFAKEGNFEELAKRQQEVAAARAAKEKERDRVEFVVPSSGRDKYGGGAAERVMRGLERERRSTPPDIGKRRERDRDRERDKDGRRRDEDVKRRRRSKSRSRSRSKDREHGGRYRDYYDSRR
ncbi:hypothetical protein RUND412_001568 [Rhizina undulata]